MAKPTGGRGRITGGTPSATDATTAASLSVSPAWVITHGASPRTGIQRAGRHSRGRIPNASAHGPAAAGTVPPFSGDDQ